MPNLICIIALIGLVSTQPELGTMQTKLSNMEMQFLACDRELNKCIATEPSPERSKLLLHASQQVNDLPLGPAGKYKNAQLNLYLKTVSLLEHFMNSPQNSLPRAVTRRASPPSPDGRQSLPGIDPGSVQDPKARAAYIKTIENNNELAKKWEVLDKLRMLSLGLPHEIVLFLDVNYRKTKEEDYAVAKINQAGISNETKSLFLDFLKE